MKSHTNNKELVDRIIEDLKKTKLRVTEPRIAILRVLRERHGPFTVEEVHQIVTKKVCDLATIYRSLASLEDAALIRRCEFGDGTSRYELAEFHDHHHHHVICRSCKKVEVLEDCELPGMNRFAEQKGFTEITHSLEFFGICANCRK